jgi:toxin CcdB
MAQFDAHPNPVQLDSQRMPFVLDVQSESLDVLSTRVVVPLLRAELLRDRIARLHPEFLVGDTRVVMVTTEIGTLSRGALGASIANFADRRAEIIGAIDMLITGV